MSNGQLNLGRISQNTTGAGVAVDDPRFAKGVWFDVKHPDYGAKGDGVADDTAAINNAINAAATYLSASNSLAGGKVYFPPGKYIVSSAITVPIVTGYTIDLVGAGMRSSYIYPKTPGQTAILFGSATQDTSPGTALQSLYSGMRNLSVNGSLLASGNATAVQFTEMNQGWMENVILEGFPASSIGLYLLGSNTTGGLGASSNAQVIGCHFKQVIVATTARPLVIQNGDENTFTECRFGMPSGLAASRGANSVFGIEIRQGRNNRFFGCEVQGDASSFPTSSVPYVGVKFCAPVNASGVANGDVKGNEFYKLVVEGHNRGIWFESSSNTLGNGVYGANFSICSTQYQNDGTQNGRGNFILAPLHGITDHDTNRGGSAAIGFTLSAGSQTVNVDAGDVFQLTGNGGGSSVTGFVSTLGNSLNGRLIAVQFVDANVTLVNGANLRLAGGVNFTSAANKCKLFMNVGGATWLETPQ